jgi:hypothetical protein
MSNRTQEAEDKLLDRIESLLTTADGNAQSYSQAEAFADRINNEQTNVEGGDQ